MVKNKKLKAGYVYILGNTELPDIIKIGEAINAEERADFLSKQTGTFGTYNVIWKHKVDDNNQAVEKALHYKFREFSVHKEYFRIDKKRAIKIASQLVKDVKPTKNSKLKQYQSLKNKSSKGKIKSASKSLWSDITKSNLPSYLKETIKLCLKEGKIGQPQYRRFSAVRGDRFTNIGRIDMYILKEKLRLVVTASKSITHTKRVIKDKIGTQVKITEWEGGVSFFVRDQKEFTALKKWFLLGKKPAT